MKKRHIFFYALFRPIVILFLKIRFGYKYEKPEKLPESYLVISNHTTDYDMLFVASSFKKQMYFVGSEHIARWGFFSKFLRYGFDPILRNKGASALSAVLDILKKTKKGYNVCLFAEGVRSWDGVTCPISKSTADLVKRAGCGLVTYKITGGYFASPMWSGASVRRGPVKGAPVRILTKEEIKELTSDEIYKIITDDLYEDAYERQLKAPYKYSGKNLANGLERLLFICPECGAHDSYSTDKDTVKCSACLKTFTYDTYGMLNASRFKTLKEFSDWQKEEVAKDVELDRIYSIDNTSLYSIKNHEETLISIGKLTVSQNKLSVGENEFSVNDVSELAMHGQNSIVFTVGRDYYEISSPKNINMLKILLFFNQAKNFIKTLEV